MAKVEIQAGPHRFTSLMSRDAVDELELEPGRIALASIKPTSVGIEVPK
jgi:molybdopterin-binding protein